MRLKLTYILIFLCEICDSFNFDKIAPTKSAQIKSFCVVGKKILETLKNETFPAQKPSFVVVVQAEHC